MTWTVCILKAKHLSIHVQYITLNVIVGPLGSLTSLIFTEVSVFENIIKWLTFNGPAMLTKSFRMLVFRTFNKNIQNETLLIRSEFFPMKIKETKCCNFNKIACVFSVI